MVLSFQMVRIIFFEELKKRVDRRGIDELKRALENDLKERYLSVKLLENGPKSLTGKVLVGEVNHFNLWKN